jgi:endonuclease-8
MPEGDTIHKIANYLAPRLQGQRIESIQMAATSPAAEGRKVLRVTARGKHLFFDLDNGTSLRSHLGMYGSWHRYPPGADWKKPRHRASLIMRISGDDYVCFNAKEVELIQSPSVRHSVAHARLGPDLIADAPDATDLAKRARDILDDDTLLADVLLDQRVASGIGNVYKSEVLFIERLGPELRLAEVSEDELQRCFTTAADRLRRNLGGGKRVTRLEKDRAGRLWVYNRRGKPCLRCDTPIRYARLGKHHRGTYWCPDCQSRL